jgi:hypothetical protein
LGKKLVEELSQAVGTRLNYYLVLKAAGRIENDDPYRLRPATLVTLRANAIGAEMVSTPTGLPRQC